MLLAPRLRGDEHAVREGEDEHGRIGRGGLAFEACREGAQGADGVCPGQTEEGEGGFVETFVDFAQACVIALATRVPGVIDAEVFAGEQGARDRPGGGGLGGLGAGGGNGAREGREQRHGGGE